MVRRAERSKLGLWNSGSLHVFQLDWHLGWRDHNYDNLIPDIRYQKKKTIYYHQLVLESALLYQDYFPLGKLRTIKGAVTLYVSANYKLSFSL